MAELNKTVSIFEGIERKTKDEYVGKPISIKAFVPMTDNDGKPYCIMLCEDENKKDFTTTGSKIILDKLVDAIKAIGKDEQQSNSKKNFFAEPLEDIVITKTKSGKNKKDYYNIENKKDLEN